MRNRKTFDDVQLDWLDLPVGEAVELDVLTEPVFALVHPFCVCRDGLRRNFACRETEGAECFWCFEGEPRAVPFAYAVVRSRGELRMFQITRSLLKKVEVRAGTRLVIRKLGKPPHFEVLNSSLFHDGFGGDYFRLADDTVSYAELEAVPERVVNRLRSVSYLLDHAPLDAFEFVNYRNE